MRVLVTGGAGFIGGNLCRALALEGSVAEVVAFDNFSTGRAENLIGTDVSVIEGDLRDHTGVRAAVSGCQSIVHLGARPSVPKSIQDPLASHDANATGTLNVLEAARIEGIRHVIVASSSSVYGANEVLPKSEHLKASPLSPYAASKLASEAYALAYGYSFGLSILAFRFFNVFGPLQPAGHSYAAVVPAFIDAALGNRALEVYGDGKQSRDFTFVETVCSVIVQAVLGRVSDAEPINLAFGTRVTLLQLIGMLEELVGHSLDRVHHEARTGDVRHSQADQAKLRRCFPQVQAVPLEHGLARTVSWFRSGCRGLDIIPPVQLALTSTPPPAEPASPEGV